MEYSLSQGHSKTNTTEKNKKPLKQHRKINGSIAIQLTPDRIQ